MPIFDKNTPITELEKLGEKFGVVSLYAYITEGPPRRVLRMPGWAWRGRAQYATFGSEDKLCPTLMTSPVDSQAALLRFTVCSGCRSASVCPAAPHAEGPYEESFQALTKR